MDGLFQEEERLYINVINKLNERNRKKEERKEKREERREKREERKEKRIERRRKKREERREKRKERREKRKEKREKRKEKREKRKEKRGISQYYCYVIFIYSTSIRQDDVLIIIKIYQIFLSNNKRTSSFLLSSPFPHISYYSLNIILLLNDLFTNF